MILGRKFELFSIILETYTVHNNNRVIFGYNNFRQSFNEVDDKALQNLIVDGVATKNGDTITVHTIEMLKVFIKEINILFSVNNEEVQANIINDSKLSFTFRNNAPLIFEVNFNPKTTLNNDKVIQFCRVYKVNFYLFWLDLLNDINMFKMFISFIKNEFENIAYQHRVTFNFFDNLTTDIVSEIFNVSIKSFFRNKENIQFEDITFNEYHHILKFIKNDNLESFKVIINGKDLIVVRSGNKIEFLSILLNRVYYPEEIAGILSELRNEISEKVSEYRKIQLIGSTNVLRDSSSGIKLLFSLSGLVLVPVNLVIFTLKLSFIIRIISFIVTLSMIFAVIFWIVLPSIRIMRFNWRVSPKKKKIFSGWLRIT